MVNPTYEQDTIKKMKAPGATIVEKDSSVLSEVIGKHNTTPPSLADGDFEQLQMDDNGNVKTALGDPAQVAILESIAGLNIPKYDYFILTYVAAGNGVGKIETATYKINGSGGTTVATVTITYNALNKIATLTKT